MTTPHKLYQVYYYHFPHYMLTRTESMMLHFILLSFTMFVGYGMYSYLPENLMTSFSKGYTYVVGRDPIAYRL